MRYWPFKGAFTLWDSFPYRESRACLIYRAVSSRIARRVTNYYKSLALVVLKQKSGYNILL